MATLPDGALMQRAASGLATACAAYLGRAYGARVLLLVGSGDNGGDALFAGATLARRGAQVEALLVADQVHEAGLAALRHAGGRVVRAPGEPDLVVDAIVGIGGRPGLREPAARIVADVMADVRAPVVAVDVPSGVGVDTGEVSGPHVGADLTVTFGTLKPCLLVDPAAAAAGVVELVDIGLGPYLPDPPVAALQSSDVRRLLPRPPRNAQKYSRGVLGVRAGSPGYTGAGFMVVAAAVKAGFAGMVRYHGASADLVRAGLPEVVIGPGQVQGWVVGSGLGEEVGNVVDEVLGDRLPTIVDADGLRHLPPRCEGPVVLTPHAGELAGMLEVPRREVEAQMLRWSLEAAQRWNAVVLLKGAHSVIAAPDGRVLVNATGVSWLATAGAGDVLSGVIGSLLGAGLSPYDAASVGAWLHGSAATLASAGGPLSASAVIAALPRAIRRCLR